MSFVVKKRTVETVGVASIKSLATALDRDGIMVTNCHATGIAYVCTTQLDGTLPTPTTSNYDYKVGPGETIPIEERGDVNIIGDTAAMTVVVREYFGKRTSGAGL